MRIFVSEYVCGGAWPEPDLPASLAREGRAMLEGIAADLARIPGLSVAATWSGQVGAFPVDGIDVHTVSDPADERRLFEQLAAECNATLVIAPEFDGILAERARAVLAVGGRLLGPAPDAIALCSDKLALARHLESHGFPTIPTQPWTPGENISFALPCVIKPRDGAGSLDVRLMRTSADTVSLRLEAAREFIQQPFVRGHALSAGVIVSRDHVHVLPIGEQMLSDDGRFTYLGGAIPADRALPAGTTALLEAVCRSIPGLHGYVGFDLILPDHESRPIICEINPRLTTAYLGYRELAVENLAARMLLPNPEPIAWKGGRVRFRADGEMLYPA